MSQQHSSSSATSTSTEDSKDMMTQLWQQEKKAFSSRTFHDVMTDLCMTLTLSYLTPIERIDCAVVSKLWSHTVRNPRVWSKATFLFDANDGALAQPAETAVKSQNQIVLPPRHIRAILYGLNLKECSNDVLLSLLSKFRSVQSLEFSWYLPHGQREEDNVLQQQQLNRELSLLHDLKSLNLLFDINLMEALLLNSSESGGVIPAIWNYASTLTSLKLSQSPKFYHHDSDSSMTFGNFLNQLSHALVEKKKGSTWPVLRIINLSLSDPWNHSSSRAPDVAIINRCFTDACLPSLTSLEVKLYANNINTVLTLQRVMTGHKLTSLQHLKHAFSYSTKYHNPTAPGASKMTPELTQLLAAWQKDPIVYGQNLTLLAYEGQEVHWSVLRTMKSLTELRFNTINNLPQKSVELFDVIGAHNLPYLAALSVEVADEPMFSESGVPLESDYARVREIMSGMHALTSLNSPIVKHKLSSASFNWFAHVYLFGNLREMNYVHSSQQDRIWSRRRTPLPLPTGVSPSVGKGHQMYSLYTRLRLRTHLLQYIETADRNRTEKFQSITVQPNEVGEEETSFEELRLIETEEGYADLRRNAAIQQVVGGPSSSSLFQPFIFSAPPPPPPSSSSQLTQIYAHLITGRIVPLMVDVTSGTIEDIKLAYERSEGVGVDRMRLIFQGRSLEDNGKSMFSYGIKENSKVSVLFRFDHGDFQRKGDTQMAYI